MNISPLAVVHPEAKIGQNTTVDPFAVSIRTRLF